MKCVNCGAEVTGGICCNDHNFIARFDDHKYSGILQIGDKRYNVRISEITTEIIHPHPYVPDRMIHTFVLQEIL